MFKLICFVTVYRQTDIVILYAIVVIILIHLVFYCRHSEKTVMVKKAQVNWLDCSSVTVYDVWKNDILRKIRYRFISSKLVKHFKYCRIVSGISKRK